MATAGKTKRGFGVACPYCKTDEDTVTIDLNDVSKCRCSECEEEFSPRQALAMMAEAARRWQAVCDWAESAPSL